MTKHDLDFYTNPMSRGRIVRWMLEEIGQPYTTHIIEYGQAMKDPAYLAINPMGKVPAIKHGEAIVTECAAICAYLADVFPDARLGPPPEQKWRANYYRWLFFAAGPLEAASTDAALGLQVPADRERMVGYGSMARAADTLELAVSQNEYICGDRFTAADVYVGMHIDWGMTFGVLEKRPNFETYVERLKSRPAAVRAREIDDALHAERQAK